MEKNMNDKNRSKTKLLSKIKEPSRKINELEKEKYMERKWDHGKTKI